MNRITLVCLSPVGAPEFKLCARHVSVNGYWYVAREVIDITDRVSGTDSIERVAREVADAMGVRAYLVECD